MTIRTKTLCLIGATLLGLLAAMYSLSASILTANLTLVEEQNTKENVRRVRDALMQKMNGINTVAISYSQWDSTRDFLRKPTPAYYAENLAPDTFTTMKIDTFALVGPNAKLVFGTNHDLKTVKNLPFDPQIRALLGPNSPLLRHTSARDAHLGILPTSPRPLLFVTRPVVDNNGKGPISGTLLMGIYLSSAEIQKLSELTHLRVEIRRDGNSDSVASQALPPDFARARNQLAGLPSSAESPAIWTHALNSETVAGYSALKDFFGRKSLLLRVDARRDIWKQGQLGIRNVMWALVLSGLIFGVLTLLLLERLVLSRLSRLSQEVGQISARRDFSRQVGAQGRDELSGLAGNVNDLLAALQGSLSQEEAQRRDIEASLREKDVLLKEVYHRVKNNLQVVSSLLALQMDGIEDPQVCAMFDESRNRVRSMALVHEKLYQSGDLGRIDFSGYLDNLAHSLLRSYSNRAREIRLEIECDKAHLDLDLAVPCGLIVNELVTNSLKYAFPDGRNGLISLRLQAVEGQFRLEVGDDGVGIPADFDPDESQSIGMQLVTGLTQQLEGTFQLVREPGTRWIIQFKAPS